MIISNAYIHRPKMFNLIIANEILLNLLQMKFNYLCKEYEHFHSIVAIAKMKYWFELRSKDTMSYILV